MIIISFLLLFAPGIITQWINGHYKVETGLELCKTIMMVVLNDFLILVGIAILFFAVYGDIVYSFSPIYSIDSSLTIFHVKFIVKYAAVDVCAAVSLGVFERAILCLMKRIKR